MQEKENNSAQLPAALRGWKNSPKDDSASELPEALRGWKNSPKDEPSFTQRVSEDYAKRSSGVGEKLAKGEISVPSAALQTAEQAGGFIGDFTMDVGKESMKYSPMARLENYAAGTDIGKAGIEKTKQAAQQVGQYVAGTDIGKAGIAKATQAKQAWDEFSKKHPEAVTDLAGSPNLLNFIPASTLGGSVGSAALSAGEKAAPVLAKAGEAATKAGVKQATEKEVKGFVDLVSPRETAKVAEENVGKTVEKGLLGRKEIIPDKFTQDIANTVSKVPGVNSGKSFQYNYNKIAAENKAEAVKLSAALKAANVTIPIEKIAQATADIKSSLARQTFLVGDAKKVSDKMLAEAGSLLKKNGNTAEGLLKTRQEFDTWAKGQMSGDPFSDSNKARGASLKAVRDSMNNLIGEAVPDAKVRDSLTKQHHLYNALDNIRSKAAREGKNAITRAAASLEDKIPTKNQYLKHAAALAGVGLGATHPATLAAAVPYVAYKGVTSPFAKKTIGKGLTSLSEVLSK